MLLIILNIIYLKIQEKIKLLNSPDITTEVVYLLKDISDEGIVKNLIKEKIDGVFHAAAYKHVDLVEKNVFSGVKNNIFASYYLCKHFNKKYKVFCIGEYR